MIDVQVISIIINYLSIVILKNLDNYNGYTDTFKVGDRLFFSYLNTQVKIIEFTRKLKWITGFLNLSNI